MSSRYFGQRISSAVRSIFKGRGDFNERVAYAFSQLVGIGEHFEQQPSEALWHEYRNLIDGMTVEKIKAMDDSELRDFCHDLIEVAFSWEREDAVYDYRKDKGEITGADD